MHERNEPVRIRKRQRLQQDAVDDAEDCGRGTDADREREHRRQRESRRLQQSANGLAELNHEAPTRACDIFLYASTMPTRATRASPCFTWNEPLWTAHRGLSGDPTNARRVSVSGLALCQGLLPNLARLLVFAHCVAIQRDT